MNKVIRRPLRFAPHYKQVIWGGDRIARYKQEDVPLANVGESWEISAVPGRESVVVGVPALEGLTLDALVETYGEALLGTEVLAKYGKHFPLIVKIIDACHDLSLQVHPDEELAQRRHGQHGKTEMWYVLESNPDARIYCGLSSPFSKDVLEQSAKDGSIMDYVAAYGSAPRQFYLVPSGTLHSIGAGNLIVEVQNTSDLTYRIYDFGREDFDGKPRELHIDEACDAINYAFPHSPSPMADVFGQTREKVVATDCFNVDYLRLDGGEKHTYRHGRRTFAIVMVTEGEAALSYDGQTEALEAGKTVLMPACIEEFSLQGNATALVIYC